MGKFINAENMQYAFDVFQSQILNELAVITNIEDVSEEEIKKLFN